MPGEPLGPLRPFNLLADNAQRLVDLEAEVMRLRKHHRGQTFSLNHRCPVCEE